MVDCWFDWCDFAAVLIVPSLEDCLQGMIWLVIDRIGVGIVVAHDVNEKN